MFRKILLIVAFLLLVVGLVILPNARSDYWRKTRDSTANASTVIKMTEEEEEQTAKVALIDESTFDAKLDMRRIRVVPNTNVGLEAAFRQRINDTCELLAEGEPLQLTQFTSVLTPRDSHRTGESHSSTRRAILTVGLDIMESDKKTLPTISRPLITRFLDSHFISLQARIRKDSETEKWVLHYRPMAAIGKFGGLPMTQEWVESVAITVRDIRGLGIYEGKETADDSQTAVLLFRSAWIEEGMRNPAHRYELGIVHARPAEDSRTSDMLELDMFTTSNQRTLWHHFKLGSVKKPKAVAGCDMVATVRFDQYMSDGLQPKSTVSRSLKVNSSATFHSAALDSYLSKSELEGGWPQNLKQAIAAMIEKKIPTVRN